MTGHQAFHAPLASPGAQEGPKHDADAMNGVPSSGGFSALLAAYRATGGTVRGDDLASLLAQRQSGDLSSLAKLIVSGHIFSFEWHGAAWVPMFQFEPADLSIKPGARKVLGELGTVLDGWALAVWFAQPNSWIRGQRPVDLLDSNLPAVFAAARADRFVATG